MQKQITVKLSNYEMQLNHIQSASEAFDVARIGRLINRFCEIHGYGRCELARAIGIDEEAIIIVVNGFGSSDFARQIFDQVRQHLDTLTARSSRTHLDLKRKRPEKGSTAN